MTATGAGVAKGLEPVKPSKWLFEHFDGTHVRTGRVIFWTQTSSLPEFLRVVDIRCPIKTPGKAKEKESEKKTEEEHQRETPPDPSVTGIQKMTGVEVPSITNLKDVVVPDVRILKQAALERPDGPALLTVYEGLRQEGDEKKEEKKKRRKKKKKKKKFKYKFKKSRTLTYNARVRHNHRYYETKRL